MNRFHAGLIALIGIFSTASAHATLISLGFGTLPSAQGWTYVADFGPANENAAFSVDGTKLVQNTNSGIFSAPRYENYGVVDGVNPWTVEITARVLADEIICCTQNFGYGFYFGAGSASGDGIVIGMATNQLRDSHFNTYLFDTTAFHDYKLVATPGVGYDLYIDNLLFAQNSLISGLFDHVALGDGTRSTNEHVEITRFVFSQNVQSSSVPEPISLALFGLGVLGLGLRRRG